MTLWREAAPEPEPSLSTEETKGARTFPTGPLEPSVCTPYSEALEKLIGLNVDFPVLYLAMCLL